MPNFTASIYQPPPNCPPPRELPEPGTGLLFLLGLFVLVIAKRSRQT